MILIIVESPTKAKALNEYLKDELLEYKVLSTYGHIKNLEAKSGSIDTSKNYEFHWKNTAQWDKHKKTLIEAAKKAEKIILATDLDREGEGIAWHVQQVLKENKIKANTERITFHSISKKSIKEALEKAGSLKDGLVESYFARIGLDYLFGFSISPILWHKVPCCKSAGRVQSVALRLIVEREYEIKNFIPEKYITIHALFKDCSQDALLIKLDDQEFENGNIFNQKIDINDLHGNFKVAQINKTETKQNPNPPFITSTLQQAASSKLNFSPAYTMQLAQKLYEGFEIKGKHTGLITYMRTDSFSIEDSAIKEIRSKIENMFGKQYLPATKNVYKTKAKNAQEAHEAIRAVDISLEPNKISFPDPNMGKLYKLIWERTMTSQMASALFENISYLIEGKNNKHTSIFELKTRKTLFPGFKILDNDENNEEEKSLNIKWEENMPLICQEIFAKDHETQAPKRYSEASLINQLEKKGIGRPSTYARIIEVLYERDYARKEKKIMHPTQKGWIVVSFLKSFFPHEVAYEFTSNLEEALDDLTENKASHINLLDKFWKTIEQKLITVKEKSPIEVTKPMQDEFPEYFLSNIQTCTLCGGSMMLKITKFGALLGCGNYPECKNVINLESQQLESDEAKWNIDEESWSLKNGPYGPYIENSAQKRFPIPKIWQNDLDHEKVKLLTEMPKNVGEFESLPLTLGIGRFGPFIKHDKIFVSIKDPLNLDFEQIQKAIIKKRTADPEKKVYKKIPQKAPQKTGKKKQLN